MRQSSPPLVRYAPLQGMDARESKNPQAPSLLYNIDCSEKGVWKERPGFKWSQTAAGKILGMQMFEVYDQALLVVVSANSSNSQIFIEIYDVDRQPSQIPTLIYKTSLTDDTGDITTGIGEKNIGSEPYSDKHYYSFAQLGRRLYFCNGYGQVFELEWHTTDVIVLNGKNILETGSRNSIMSYIMGNFSPASLHLWYGQMVATGFSRAVECPISNPLASDTEFKAKPLISPGRDTVYVDPGVISISHWAQPKSFPLEDQGAHYWFPERDVVATGAIQDRLLVFSKTGVDVIQGHPEGVRRSISERSVVSHRAFVNFGDFLFFVAHDGCFMTDGNTVTKVSEPMDPLWFGRESPDVTRYTEDLIKNTAYPFHVNRHSLRHAHCINDRAREQIMVFLPSGGCGDKANMCWVWNYSDLLAGADGASGKWSIWSGNEEAYWKAGNSEALTSTYSAQTSSGACSTAGGVWNADALNLAGTAYTGFCSPPVDVLENPSTYSTVWNATASVEYNYGPTSRVFVGTYIGAIVELGTNNKDVTKSFKVLAGLGRVGPVDPGARVVFTDVAVRKKQMSLNADDTGGVSVPSLVVAAQSEAEALNLILSTDTDVEFTTTVDNMNDGISRATKSALGTSSVSGTTMTLGALPSGSSSPLISPAHHEEFARLNLPSGEGSTVIVDLYSSTAPHALHIDDVIIHGTAKGGANRESGGASSSGKVMV